MADIRAFHAMRYTKSAGEAKELTCPPYDIISEAERAAFLERNPHNVIRLELPRGEEPYKTAGKTLHTWFPTALCAVTRTQVFISTRKNSKPT